MRSRFSFSLHRLFAAIAILAAVPVTVAATHAAIPAFGVAHGTTVHLAAPAAASTRTTSSAPASFFFTANSQWSTEAQNARLSSISTLVASGFLDIALTKRGEYAGLAMYHAGETKYAVCTENGAQAMELEPLLPGAPED